MRKIIVLVVFLTGFLTMSFVWGIAGAKADDEAMINNSTQNLKDEGYGNDDAEYYNSGDNLINDEEDFTSQNNINTNEALANDAQ